MWNTTKQENVSKKILTCVEISFVMKKLILFVLLVFPVLTTFAQIRPPQQTDTIYISAVKYNYADIRQENWPCSVIYKSTTSFKIGEDEFTILKASKTGFDVDFVVTDKEGKERYILTYIEGRKDITVKFSGYEFICRKIPNEAPGVSSYSEESPFTAHVILTGRSINGALPSFFSDKTGKVVVDIWVDNYGTVQKAVAGAEGTTVTDRELWNKARSSAMQASFNMSADAPAMQKGTITYTLKEDKNVEAAVPFQLVEEKPTFQGGDSNQFSKWVNQRLVYPDSLKKQGIQGRVTLQFTVQADGTVGNVRVLRGVHPDLDNEAVRVVASSPKWNPGKCKDKAVPVTYTFPVIFQAR